MPPKVVVSNPYAKKRKKPTEAPPSSSSGATSRPNANSSNSGGPSGRATSAVTGDKLLPSNYKMIPGSFSQAFTSIDETDDFRRASETFETDIRDNQKRESFRLAKVKKGRRPKNKNIFEPQSYQSGKDKSEKSENISSTLSNRDGGGVRKQHQLHSSMEGKNSKQEQDLSTGKDEVLPRDSKENPSNGNTNTSSSDSSSDVRIHHTMLQPHVLYVSTRQKGNSILPLIRNVPIAYSPMVPDYILGPTSCALFLSIKYHKLYPRYIHRRIAELRKDFKLRVLLVLVDVDDNANTLLQLNTIGVTNQLTVILCWSELEAARYLETYKVRDGKDAAPIQKRESANPLDRVIDFMTGGRAGVNKTDAVTLWSQFSTISGIAGASADELALVGGMGPVKVRRLHEALHKPFSKLRSKERKRQKQQENEEEAAAQETTTATKNSSKVDEKK
eukprot:CAMPEP_0116134930 /NCGR_PEP_ID=MMETSP0329-20121206/10920_1 /TAXON_ID=697910 /ORGANISM="Pseudo-nitzschia arenysensis, Strain B593" /LENGTH=445 /DNA_ID=CAMNT_0003629697 /DNA_START=141 /DNA_END=1478 /DNA_ORIENTATION=+